MVRFMNFIDKGAYWRIEINSTKSEINLTFQLTRRSNLMAI